MCGRYALGKIADDLIEEFDLDDTALAFMRDGWTPDYNVAPTKTAPVILERLDEGANHEGATGEPQLRRTLAPLRWGLIPHWAKDAKIGVRMINARSETLLEKPAFRTAASRRRCIVPADGWYEWVVSPAGKRPHFMTLSSGGTCAMAGIYESWTDPTGSRWETFAVITTAAEPELAWIHDRMPVVLPEDRWSAWLDPDVRQGAEVAGLIQGLAPGRFAVREVSTLVNAVRNRGPECIAPLGG